MESMFHRIQNSRWVAVVFSAFLGLAILATALPQPVMAAAGKCAVKHTVEAGDTVHYLADLYNADWRDIVEANDLKEPYTLIIGQVLCIPEGTKPANSTGSTTSTADDVDEGKNPSVNIDPGFASIVLEVKNFPKYTTYYLNLANAPQNPVFYRLGRMRTDKNGVFLGEFKLPLDLPNTRYFTLCIKNVWTDENACGVYENPYYYFIWYQDACKRPRRVLAR